MKARRVGPKAVPLQSLKTKNRNRNKRKLFIRILKALLRFVVSSPILFRRSCLCQRVQFIDPFKCFAEWKWSLRRRQKIWCREWNRRDRKPWGQLPFLCAAVVLWGEWDANVSSDQLGCVSTTLFHLHWVLLLQEPKSFADELAAKISGASQSKESERTFFFFFCLKVATENNNFTCNTVVHLRINFSPLSEKTETKDDGEKKRTRSKSKRKSTIEGINGHVNCLRFVVRDLWKMRVCCRRSPQYSLNTSFGQEFIEQPTSSWRHWCPSAQLFYLLPATGREWIDLSSFFFLPLCSNCG